jgi:serine/threonine protein kinase
MRKVLTFFVAVYIYSSLGKSQDDEDMHPFHRGPRLLGGDGSEVSLYNRVGYMCDPRDNCRRKVLIDRHGELQQSLPLEMAPGGIGPFPGMVLHVKEKDEKVIENFGIEKREAGAVNIYHRSCCNSYGTSDSEETKAKRYELVESFGGQLGSTIVHKHDFAYRPVFALPSESQEEWEKGGYWWDNHMFRRETDYERNGHRAFAGGSHGEVWRAKRRCHQIVVNVGTQNEDHHSRYNGRKQQAVCDTEEQLIMKRLLVGKSYELLEAGLREIYFGDILARNEEPTSLFTSYLDHFFHQSPSNNVKDLELWIVFAYAGPSLRSLLYSPIENESFVMYQHSAFWMQLRTGEQIMKHTDASYSVALREIVPSDNEDVLDMNDKKDEPDRNDREEADAKVDGQDVLKSVLQQLFSSAAKLHERGIVHRDIKPSNIMCDMNRGISNIYCRLGDFSSAYDEYASEHLYSQGPSRAEQTDEYAPPEALFSDDAWIPFDEMKPESYDSWSLGIVILELLLGTPHVFSVDKRTTAVLTKKLTDEGGSDEDIRRALYLAALAQFCIYRPTSSHRWPMREGDPLFKTVSGSSLY